MSSLRLLQVLEALLTTADLYGVVPVLLNCLHLSDLAPVDLYDGTWHDLSPLVPEVRHADLIAKQAHPLALAILWGSLCELVLRVNLILKRRECLSLIRLTMSCRGSKRSVVENLCLVEILIPYPVQLRNRKFLFGGCRGKEACWLSEKDGSQKHGPASIECLVDDLRQHI